MNKSVETVSLQFSIEIAMERTVNTKYFIICLLLFQFYNWTFGQEIGKGICKKYNVLFLLQD